MRSRCFEQRVEVRRGSLMDARTPATEHHEDERDEKRSFGDRVAGVRDAIRARPLVTAGVAILVIVLIVAALLWWLHARQFESTDDAFIDTRVVSIASQVNGAIVEVDVTDNAGVDANTVLLRIDDRDYRAALEQARAQVAQRSEERRVGKECRSRWS